jgi:hypothetical protein
MPMLRDRQITLLDPAKWEDRNDAYYIAEYKRRLNAKRVLALCFTESSERHHHWRVFAGAADGVCLIFNKAKVLAAFDGDGRVTHRPVEYRAIASLQKEAPVDLQRLPFLKRYAFAGEDEYRVVFTDAEEDGEFKRYPLELTCIERITAAAWMPRREFVSARRAVRAIAGCEGIKFERSSLLENERWKGIAKM